MRQTPPDARVAWLVAILGALLVLVAGFMAPNAESRTTAPQRALIEANQRTPAAAEQYRAAMTRSAYRIHGPSAPVAMLAGQIHQESAWQPRARSHAGAEGLAQFMPGTASDMAARFPGDCAPADPFSAGWAFTCRDRYMASLRRQVQPLGGGLTECTRWVYALRAYNGGMGWINRDRRKATQAGADPDDWIALQGFNAGRSAANFKENVEYAPRILRLQARYRGWGAEAC